MNPRIEWLSSLPLKYLLAAVAKKGTNTLQPKGRFEWTVYEVSHSIFPDSDARNYYDARNIRQILTKNQIPTTGAAAELACGYGRLVPVLTEFSDRTYGFEREPNLVEIAKRHIRDVSIIKIDDLLDVKRLAPEPLDLLMIITVLQHLTDKKNEALAKVIGETVKPGGYLLLCESTDTSNLSVQGQPTEETAFLSKPRPLDFYKSLYSDFDLVDTSERVLEKTYDTYGGTLMLFRRR